MDQESIRTLVRYGVNLIWTCAADDKTKMENMLIIQLLIFHTCFNATVVIQIKQKIWSTERASKRKSVSDWSIDPLIFEILKKADSNQCRIVDFTMKTVPIQT